MPFEGLKQITINEQIKAPIMVDNSDKGPKYAKPELQNFHEDIIKKYEKTNGNTTIINVSNILEDKVVQKEDINIKIEETKKQRKATKESYANLDKTKYPEPTTEEISKGKTQIKKDTQQKLEAQGLSIDEYARFLIFEQKYEKNLREEGKMEFLNNLKKLKEDLGEKTTLQKTIDPKNTDKLIDANKSLKNYTDNSNKFDKITAPYDSIQNTEYKNKIENQLSKSKNISDISFIV